MYVQYGNVYVWFCDKWNTLVQKFVKWDKMSAKNHLPYIWTYVYNIVMSIWSSVKKYQMRQNFSQAKSTLYMNTCVQYGLVYVLLCKRLADIIAKKLKWGGTSTIQLLRQSVWCSTPELEKEIVFKSTNNLNVLDWTSENTVIS